MRRPPSQRPRGGSCHRTSHAPGRKAGLWLLGYPPRLSWFNGRALTLMITTCLSSCAFDLLVLPEGCSYSMRIDFSFTIQRGAGRVTPCGLQCALVAQSEPLRRDDGSVEYLDGQ